MLGHSSGRDYDKLKAKVEPLLKYLGLSLIFFNQETKSNLVLVHKYLLFTGGSVGLRFPVWKAMLGLVTLVATE